jgi:acyl-CoA synthetase (AMP-forming)/AMP-acid ligase II
MRVIEHFDRGAALNPQGVAFVGPNGEDPLTYAETLELTHRIGAALQRDGIGEGATVAVLSPNGPMTFPAVLGIFRAGAVWVHLNARSTAEDIADLLDLVGCRALLYAAELEDTVQRVADRVNSIERLVCIDGPEAFENWLADPGVRVPTGPLDPESIAAMAGTGGTTGRSKAVELSHRAYEAMIMAFHAHMPEVDPVHLVAAPMSHAAGSLVFPVLSLGGTNVIHHGVDAEEIFASIERNRVTRLFLPPTAIYSLLSHPTARDWDVSSLRYFLYAAAPMSVSKLSEALTIFGPVMAQCFGQAEAPMMCTFHSPADHVAAAGDPRLEHRLASCGQPSLVARVAIMDDAGKILETGERGEIVVRSSLNMNGYHRDPEQTEAARRPGGWHATGDVGYIDSDGFVYIVDRKRDVIITGGFNVFPSEVEQVIWGHPAVGDCAVIGVPHEKWGEQVTAVVELKAGAELDTDELIALCKQRLGSVKAPKEIVIRSLPRSPVGKVLKRALRDEYWSGRSRMV